MYWSPCSTPQDAIAARFGASRMPVREASARAVLTAHIVRARDALAAAFEDASL